MATTMLTEVVVNSVTISSSYLLSWKVIETFGQEIGDCVIEVSNGIYTAIPNLESGNTVTIKRGTVTATDQFIFDGYVDKIEKEGAIVRIYGRDKMIDLLKASVTYSYDGIIFPSTESKGSDIATSLIQDWAGMTATVVDTGSVLTLNKFICNGTDVFSRLQMLAKIYDYQIYYDNDDGTIHFEPKGYTSSGTTIYAGGTNNNVKTVPKWIFDNSQCINKLTVKGAVQEVRDTEYFDGNGAANQTFDLTKMPISVEAWEDVAGTWTLKVPGVEGSTSGAYDYDIDKENRAINCTDNWTPASGTNNVRIEYVNAIPVPVNVEDTDSQSKYGVYQAEKFFSDIQTVTDAENRGNAWIDKFSTPFVNVKFKVATLNDFDVGTQVTIVDDINNETREVVINKIIKKYPHDGDEFSCGDEEWRLADWGDFTLERIRRLEEENQKNTDLIIHIRSLPNTTVFKRRYLKGVINSVTGDGFILGYEPRAELGTDKLGSPLGPDNVVRIIWPEETYIERFIDTDFEGSGNANWDDTNNQLVFTYS